MMEIKYGRGYHERRIAYQRLQELKLQRQRFPSI